MKQRFEMGDDDGTGFGFCDASYSVGNNELKVKDNSNDVPSSFFFKVCFYANWVCERSARSVL